MSDRWIKIECKTPDKPEIAIIAAQTGIDLDSVVGKLVRIWAWAARHCNSDGVTDISVKPYIDRITCTSGFADAMIEAGWLEEHNGLDLKFSNFKHHMKGK